MRIVIRTILVSCLIALPLVAQLRVSGQATAGYFQSEGGFSQYTIDAGRATFAWRWDVFMDAGISDRVAFFFDAAGKVAGVGVIQGTQGL